jgi:hypothetical protein
MKQVFDMLQQELTSVLLENPIDYGSDYYNSWITRQNGTIMPPSPGVQGYILNYDFAGNELAFELRVEWREVAKWLFRTIPSWQVTHRSRTAVIAASPLRVPEDMKRNARVMDWMPTFSEFSLDDSASETVYDLVLGKTLEYLDFNKQWISHYITEHEASSMGGGFHWRDTFSMSEDQWRKVFDLTVEFVEKLRANPGKFLNIQYNSGLRARSPSADNFSDVYTGIIDRSRIINFHAALSIWNVFLPNKKDWYADILHEVESLFSVTPTIHYPFTEGGGIYLTVSELFHSDLNFKAMDGKSWDGSVGVILGNAFKPLLLYSHGLYTLGSGIALTSLLGTIANVIVNRKREGEMVILGDDMNYWFKRETRINVPWIEEEIGDTRSRSILGAAFFDPDKPVTTGLKVMSDRADKAKPLNLTDRMGMIPVSVKRDPREVSIWAGMYLGWYGDDTLINQLKRTKLENLDFVAPSKIINDLVTEHPDIDPFAWAEREGVKNLVVV